MSFKSVIIYVCIIGSIFYIASAEMRAWRYVQRDLVVILPVVNDVDFMFDTRSVIDWSFIYDGRISAERLTRGLIESETQMGRAASANISISTALSSDYSIVISESLADALFSSVDVLGLEVSIGGIVYEVSEVVAGNDSFAKITSRCYTQLVNIVYMLPNNYNKISAYWDAIAFLESMNRLPIDYTITDINTYVSNIALRWHILMAFFVLFIVIKIVRWLRDFIHLNSAHRFVDYAILIFFAVLASGIVILLLRQIPFSIWRPAFAREGLLAPRQYLPANLAALLDLNQRANVAFGIGLAGFAGLILKWKNS